MSTWFQLLPIELNNINNDSIVEPDATMVEGDHIVGEMPDLARRLYTLSRTLARDSSQYLLDSSYCRDELQRKELKARAIELKAKYDVVNELLWIGLRDEFAIWGESVGVRKEFKVVVMDERHDMPPFLERLLGGGW